MARFDNTSQATLPGRTLSQQTRQPLQIFLVDLIESLLYRTININDRYRLPINQYWDNNLRLGRSITSNMAREGLDVGHQLGFLG